MQKFINSLKKRNIFKGEKLDSESLIVAQKLLVNMHLDFLPHSYVDFLKQFNGIKADGAYLFGATVDDDLDIIDKNEQMRRPKNCILLGYNDFDLLVYNFKNQHYQIIDRDDFTVIDEYGEDEAGFALSQIFS
ncbi:MAG: hypothetical protein IKO06_05880, partial [Alphaproteobacteria bacterium]|nr:hypothetical protein [Alphaproteobacteria bacterium]